MLQIRPEQMKVLQQTALDDFVVRLVAHLHLVFPDRYDELGEERTRQLVRLSQQRAATYGIRSERDVCAYVEVLFSLHREDETGPDMQWARVILGDPYLGAAQKIAHLGSEAGKRLQTKPVAS
jgi:NADPH-dependent ferric siderophore reductase